MIGKTWHISDKGMQVCGLVRRDHNLRKLRDTNGHDYIFYSKMEKYFQSTSDLNGKRKESNNTEYPVSTSKSRKKDKKERSDWDTNISMVGEKRIRRGRK